VRIGVLKESRADEYRVALTPAGARELVLHGHDVFVVAGAGEGSALPDSAYASAGARIMGDSGAVIDHASLLLKVKEPTEEESARFRRDHLFCSFLHLAPNRDLTHSLLLSGATCLAYETVETGDGSLPLLAPMSEIAGRLAPHAGAYFLERGNGGKGKLLGGVSGVPAARVTILGAGIVGFNAALIASGMRARVTVVDSRMQRLQEFERHLPAVEPLMSTQLTLEEEVSRSDLVIAAVLVPGAMAPKLVTEDLVKDMQAGSVIMDVSIDQGGAVETSYMTTHSHPVFLKHQVVHYAVGNMPGAVPITSTIALSNVILPYVLQIADEGLAAVARRDPTLARGVNVMEGKVTNPRVAEATGFPYFPLESLLPIDYV
jgi:alanine dehydrogenase